MELSMVPLAKIVFDIFIISSLLITAYTCNFYYLAYLSRRRKDRPATVQDAGEPSITIQLPIYNEKYVARRLVDAVCALDYPRSKMRIMVLDDSDDDTVGMMRDVVSHYSKEGFKIEHIRRGTRAGYKAGALKHAMKSTDTELVAIFDADFMPPAWFLRRAIPHLAKPDIGLVQCRWGHVNEKYSAITRAQALSLDFHFLIEQKAKSNSKLFMNFNGTAGIWRRECIEDSGGWHTATLVEDLDLSYRAQMKNWRCVFPAPHSGGRGAPHADERRKAPAVQVGKRFHTVRRKAPVGYSGKQAGGRGDQGTGVRAADAPRRIPAHAHTVPGAAHTAGKPRGRLHHEPGAGPHNRAVPGHGPRRIPHDNTGHVRRAVVALKGRHHAVSTDIHRGAYR